MINFYRARLERFLACHRARSSANSRFSLQNHTPPQQLIDNPTMSRSVSDATRFTATSPHAYSKPTPMRSTPSTYTASSSNFQNPYRFPKPANKGSPSNPPPNPSGHGSGPPEETAAEKVARLRAARLKEREAQVTTWDRIVLRGRVWADRAHKVTVYSLVGFSSTPLPSPLSPTLRQSDANEDNPQQ